MAEKEIIMDVKEGQGALKIASDVIATIAAQALTEIKGISLATEAGDNFVDKLVKKATAKGIRIYFDEETKKADIDVHISILYGLNISEVSWKVQEAVKKNIEMMTDVSVNLVNVFVDGVILEKEPKPEKPKKVKDEKKSEEA